MKRIMIAAALALPLAVHAAEMNCSIKAKGNLPKSEQMVMAKVKADAAQKFALEKVATAGATVHHGGLEVEDGCLVYTYDVKVPNKRGFEEVFVDAGTGEVLKVEHESAAKEAAEKTGDKVKTTVKKAKDAVIGERKPS